MPSLRGRYRRRERQEQARERQAARRKRGDYRQMLKLEKAGHTNCKEYKRLRKLFEEAAIDALEKVKNNASA